MMIKIKKPHAYRFCLSLLMLSVLLFLVACTTNRVPSRTATELIETSSPSRTPAPTRTPATAATQSTPVHLMVDKEDLAGVVVRFVHPWTGALADALEDIAARFSVTNAWDIWVEVEAPGGETSLVESLEADIAEGNIPGLIAAYPYQLTPFDGDIFTVNLTSYINDSTWGLSEEVQGDIPYVFLEQFTADGTLKALPVAPQATVLFYNQSWGEDLGFPSMPNEANDFLEQSCQAVYANIEDKNEDNDGTGGWLVSLEAAVLAGWFDAFEGNFPVDGIPSFNSDAGEQAFGYLKSAYDQGCFWIGRQPEPYYYFANRYALSYAGTLDQIPAQMGWMQAAESEDVWRVMGFPGPGGETILVGGPGLMVTADSPENQMAAWLFARYLLEPEVQAELVSSGFTLPVRESALDLLSDFSAAYPQWAQAVLMVDRAAPLPVSDGWGVAQWVLQDALYQLMHLEITPGSSISAELAPILQVLDESIIELEGMTP